MYACRRTHPSFIQIFSTSNGIGIARGLCRRRPIFYTNLVSAEHFIENLEATSLSMDSSEFEKQMHSARALLDVNLSAQPSITEKHTLSSGDRALKPDEHGSPRVSKHVSNEHGSPRVAVRGEPGPGLSVQKEDQKESRELTEESAALAAFAGSAPVSPKDGSSEKAKTTVAQLEASGLPEVLEAEKSGELAHDYRYLFARAGDLRVMDVELLLADYKELVLKYAALCKAVEGNLSVQKQSSPLIDLREPSNTIQEAGETYRSTEPQSPVERQSKDQAFVKEEDGES